MSSYTSNSKRALPFKSLLVFVILLVSYNCLVILFRSDHWIEPQSDRYWNTVKAQNYIFADGNEIPRVVFVGTSLTNRLPIALSNNLAFDGGSPLTGLQIILSSGKYPDVVIIETNFLDHQADKDFVGQLFTSGIYDLHLIFPVLRERHQPVNLVGVLISGLFGKISAGTSAINQVNNTGNKSLEGNRGKTTDDVLNMALAIHKKNFSVKPDGRFDKTLSELKEIVDKLSMHGVQIVFHEMPMHPELADSPRSNSIRSKIFSKFPDMKVSIMVDNNYYETIDGIHLSADGSAKYAALFQAKVRQVTGADVRIFNI